MRQPLSIYVRSARRSAEALFAKVQRRLRALFSQRAPTTRTSSQQRSRATVNVAELKAAFDSLGLGAGDTVLVHSGISNLGKVVGGARGVFDLIQDQVGGEGNVLYPAFPFNTLMASYLATKPTFDVATSPTKMGALTEYALKTAKGLRSIHPTHSILAFGPRGAQLVNGHHRCTTPFGDDSPFGRLVEAGGKILLIGVDLNSTTSFHRIEDRLGADFPVQVYLPEVFRIPCTDMDGRELEVITRAHDPFVSRVRDCNLVREAFLQEGVMREIAVGDGVVGLLDARAMDELLDRLWHTRRKTIYGSIWG